MQRAMIVKLMAKAVKTLCCKFWGQGMLGNDQNASQGSRHGEVVSKRPGACWNDLGTFFFAGIQKNNDNRWDITWKFKSRACIMVLLMVYHEVLQEQYFHIFPRCQYLSIGSPLRTKLTEVIAAHASYPKGMQGLCVCHETFMWWKSIVMV